MMFHIRKKGRGLKLFFIFLLLLLGIIFYFRDFVKFDWSIQKEADSRACVLSPCDCRCYPPDEAPEINLSRVCSKDCRAWENIEGCELVDGRCGVVKKRDSGMLTRQIFFRGNRYVPADRSQADSTFIEFSGERVTNTTDDNALTYEIWIRKSDDSVIFIYKDSYFEIWLKENDPFG